MQTLKAWIKAFRLRTLPLSVSSIILGTALAGIDYEINYKIVGLILLTTLFLQILSNLANDYGDAVKGADNENRVGPTRTVQSGVITLKQMKIAMFIFALLALISGLMLLFKVFNNSFNGLFVFFFILGLSAILAAIKYTVGQKAYGYSAKGDLFVFIFFGLVAVLGTYFLLTKSISVLMVLPAITIGGFSVAVLNLNNMRDIVNDKVVGKITLAVKIGAENAKKYHYALFFWTYLSYILFCIFKFDGAQIYKMLIPLFIVGISHGLHLKNVSQIQKPEQFDPELKKIALSALLFSCLVYAMVLMM